MARSAQDTTAGSGERYRSLWRVPGILFATAALVVAFSGAHALQAPAFVATPDAAPPAPSPTAAPAPAHAPAADPTHVQAATEPALPFATGAVLDADQRALFEAHIAALKERGEHRGPAFYTSW